MFGMFALFAIFALATFFAVVAGVGVLFSTIGRHRRVAGPVGTIQDPPKPPPTEVLDERLRSGDISAAEYQRRRQQLDEDPQHG